MTGQTYNGLINSSYYATLSSSGIGVWQQTSSYPIIVEGESCTAFQGFVYCVGGSTNGFFATNNSTYYNTLNPYGLGQWVPSADYPTNTSGNSCVTTSSITYCLGNGANSIYFGFSSSAGILGWFNSTYNYPINVTSPYCVTNSSHIYCIGGIGGKKQGSMLGGINLNTSYYSQIFTGFPNSTISTSTTSTSSIYPLLNFSTTISNIIINSTTISSAGNATVPPNDNSNSTSAPLIKKTGSRGFLIVVILIVIVVVGILVWILIKKMKNRK